MVRRSSLFPHIPRTKRIVDKIGELTEHWHLSLMNLYQTLQSSFRSTGYLLPNMAADEFTSFRNQFAPYDNKILPTALANNRGLTAFDVDNNVPKVFIIVYNSNKTLNFSATNWKTYTIT